VEDQKESDADRFKRLRVKMWDHDKDRFHHMTLGPPGEGEYHAADGWVFTCPTCGKQYQSKVHIHLETFEAEVVGHLIAHETVNGK
jgi:hypothetical protein